jgi:hypothetical protein
VVALSEVFDTNATMPLHQYKNQAEAVYPPSGAGEGGRSHPSNAIFCNDQFREVPAKSKNLRNFNDSIYDRMRRLSLGAACFAKK